MAETVKKRTGVLVKARHHTLSTVFATPRPTSMGAELERRERQLAALYELWRFAPHTELERLLKHVTERAVAALDAHTGSVFLRERGTDVLRMVASVGLPRRCFSVRDAFSGRAHRRTCCRDPATDAGQP